MRLPNGYGSVINLGKNRRRPFGVRITDGLKLNSKGKYVQKYKYLEYFEKRTDAFKYLADYNSGRVVEEHKSYTDIPTFKKVFDEWLDYKMGLKKTLSEHTVRNYKIAFNRYENLHDKKFQNIRTKDIQLCADKFKDKSGATVGMMRTVLNQMYEYAIKHEYADKNYVELCDFEYSDEKFIEHLPFTPDEINKLWENKNRKDVDLVLMMIYSGLRASEFLGIETKNINLEEDYIIAGLKTEAGKDRVMPIHHKIRPFIEKYYDENNEYLIINTKSNKINYSNFNNTQWKSVMKKMEMSHTPHDTRHTFITLAKRYGVDEYALKTIVGHQISDLTENIYTHRTPQELKNEIEKIEI